MVSRRCMSVRYAGLQSHRLVAIQPSVIEINEKTYKPITILLKYSQLVGLGKFWVDFQNIMDYMYCTHIRNEIFTFE